MTVSPRRARRIRDELRLWLRSRHGMQTQYSRKAIDRGREELGFAGVGDALVAYTLFGGDMMPAIVDSLDVAFAAEEIGEVTEIVSDMATDTTALLLPD